MKNNLQRAIILSVILLLAGKAYTQPSISYGTNAITFNVGDALKPPFALTTTGTTNAGQTTTLAGSGAAGLVNGTGIAASFNNPLGMAVDASGNVYVADAGNNVIRKITPAGAVSTYAGSGAQGAANGAAATSTFNKPTGLSFDIQGNLYVADQNNNMIRMITPSGTVSTLAGGTRAGRADGTGSAAQFNSPMGVLADVSGNVYVADFGNNKIRLITAGGVVTTFAGGGKAGFLNGQGTNAIFNGPYSLAMDKSGNLYVGDKLNYMVRLITPAGYVSTFAGNGTVGHNDGNSSVATLTFPLGLGFDAAGNLYVADSHDSRIRKITPGGRVSTLSGTTAGAPVNGSGNVATFDDPKGLSVDQSGNIYVGDSGNNLVRQVLSVPYTISAPLPSGLIFDPNTGNISGTPVSVAAASNYTVTAYSYSGQRSTSLALTIAPAGSINPSTNQNFIITYTPRVGGILTNPALTAASVHKSKVETSIEYFDGLGRPMQTVQVKGSPTGSRDMVQPVAYDQFGREAVKYLPYTVLPSAASDGSYKTTAIADEATFYAAPSGTQWKTGVVSTPFSTMQTVFEPSPLNRVTQQGAAGDNWQLAGTPNTQNPGHTVNITYGANSDGDDFNGSIITNNPGSHMVILYTTNISRNFSQTLINTPDPDTGNPATYGAGQLYLTITKDENWNPATDGCLGTTEEYKDLEGHIVCKRTYNYNNTSGQIEMLSTYYVYDDMGNLAFVLPPLASPDYNTQPDQNTLNNLCYQYQYDQRQRLGQKRLPGKGWESMVYDALDRLVATQDANQQNHSQWKYIQYDALDRVTTTGITNLNRSWALLQADFNQEEQGGGKMLAWPYTDTGNEVLTINYYDNYNNIPFLSPNYSNPNTSIQTTGLLTATSTEALGMGDMLGKVVYYDDYGRPVQTFAQHYLDETVDPSNFDAITTIYQFTNEVKSITRQHYNYLTGFAAGPVLTITNSYLYDHMGRKLQTWEQISGSTINSGNILLSQTDYNQVGQVMTKHLHSTDGANFYQDINYAYNERGWLLQSNAQLFNEQLQYNLINTVAGISPTAQFNGNIASQTWTAGTNLAANSFVYTYDKLNRLISGITNDNSNSEVCTYDMGGNITSLARVFKGTPIDNLTYNYTNPAGYYTNQVQGITDGSGDASGVGYPTGQGVYHYDPNGNINTFTSNAQVKYSITYNLLNLPNFVGPSPQNSNYTYDAAGTKLSRSSGINETDYISGIQYDNDNITFIQTEEGRAIPDGPVYNFEYNLGDHLGNTRLTFDTQSGLANTVQQDDYLPFGMDISVGSVPYPKNEYLYNKKEFQEQLHQYDYGARFYDPVIGRWNVVDPLAEISRRWSPYCYGKNNPIRNVDIDGMFSLDIGSPGQSSVDIGPGGKVIKVNDDGDPGVYLDKDGKRNLVGFMNPDVTYNVGDTYNYYGKKDYYTRYPQVYWLGMKVHNPNDPNPDRGNDQATNQDALGAGIIAILTDGLGEGAEGGAAGGTALTRYLKEMGYNTNTAGEFFGWGSKTKGLTKTIADFTEQQLLEAGWTREKLIKLGEVYEEMAAKSQAASTANRVNTVALARAKQAFELAEHFFGK